MLIIIYIIFLVSGINNSFYNEHIAYVISSKVFFMNQNEKNEKEWKNSDNWKWYTFYHCEKDSRVWVPKRPKWCGWTLNFAKKQSYIWLLLLLIIPIIIVLIVALT